MNFFEEQIFTKTGMFKKNYDPYRETENGFHKKIFDKDGNVRIELWEDLEVFVRTMVDPMCDAVKLYHANYFANNTKGNYSATTYWR